MKNKHYPYIFGRPVNTAEFLNRKSELIAVFNRIKNCESTAIIGEPHIGKSSILLLMKDGLIQKRYLGENFKNFKFLYIDLQTYSLNENSVDFWKDVLSGLVDEAASRELRTVISHATNNNCPRRELEKVFMLLAQEGKHAVLLLDEFDWLLKHKNFQDPAFFALLRSLATRTGGLAIVIASRLSLAKMNEVGRGLLDTGSPFFNHMIEIRLHPFEEDVIEDLFEMAGKDLAPNDHLFIRRVAGRHPYLLQAMTATYLETISKNRYTKSAEVFYERIAFHFDDLWSTMDSESRTTAVILCLMELGGRMFGNDFSFGEIENVEKFGPELRKLEERGLAECVSNNTGWKFDTKHLLIWRGEQWTIGAQAFTWWVRDVVVAETRHISSYDDWLSEKKYRLLLTQNQWESLLGILRKSPKWAVSGVAALTRALVSELVRKD